ncbi:hypothetical protein CRENBAI_009787 [Crenichthys baileyi]|uniref:Uncharacterized protein n=1 Tax=Crenichthys baileyi TaxID=28760 RepID=A0AAV9QUF8_9TELE
MFTKVVLLVTPLIFFSVQRDAAWAWRWHRGGKRDPCVEAAVLEAAITGSSLFDINGFIFIRKDEKVSLIKRISCELLAASSYCYCHQNFIKNKMKSFESVWGNS